MTARRVRRAMVLALAMTMTIGVAAVAARPETGGRDIQSFANAEFELALDDCTRAYLGVSFVAGENLQGPIGSGQPGSWSDVTARLNLVDTCLEQSLAYFDGWIPVPPTIETFESATLDDVALTIPGGNDETLDVFLDLTWTGLRGESVRTEQNDGYIRAERTVPAELAGTAHIGPGERFPEGLTYGPENAFDARLGWAAEIDTLARPACLTPSGGLTDWWTGDGTLADRVGGLDATSRGGAGFGRGMVRAAFELDGINDYLEVGDADGLDVGSSDFTVTAWVRFDTVAGEQVIVEKWLQGNESFASEGWTLTKLDDHSIRLAVSGDGGLEVNADTETGIVESGRWYLISARRTGGEITVLVDGVPRASSVLAGESDWSLSNEKSMLIGRRDPASDDRGFHVNGSIDEVQLYNGTAVSDTDLWLQWVVGPAGLCR